MTPQDGDASPADSPPPANAPVLTRSVTVPNKRGLHARAAAKFVMLAEQLRRLGGRDPRRAVACRRAPSWD